MPWADIMQVWSVSLMFIFCLYTWQVTAAYLPGWSMNLWSADHREALGAAVAAVKLPNQLLQHGKMNTQTSGSLIVVYTLKGLTCSKILAACIFHD